MLPVSLIEYFFTFASIKRWNDYPKMVELVELDKQAHKFIIAFFLANMEKDINKIHLIEAGIFELLRRGIITDIRPDIFRDVLQKKEKELNEWVLSKLHRKLIDIEDGKFYERFKNYLEDSNMYKKERFILKAASYIATRWEFKIVYQTSKFLSEIDQVKDEVEDEIKDYYELIGVKEIALNKNLVKIIDLSGRLRFQKRWAQTPRIPETSVLGHMLIVAIFGYFYSTHIKACELRVENNFYCALFHDLPEALTRDIISPVKYSVSGLDDIISEYEIKIIENKILPHVPLHMVNNFKYLLGLYGNNQKDEFLNKINNKNIEIVDSLTNYNENKYNAIDGVALKNCDRLSAFIEVILSISHGVKSKELAEGKEVIKKSLKTKGKVDGVDFYELAVNIENYFSN
ncbi:MAG: HD domain-containing protein [Sulfurospirillum sp.]|nr:HD domain-containing protein [Sulfurospirillum sp.]